ncbi:MAG: N-acetylmuramoyl-L-alanine amidase [Alphaproteobacteria bacterium]
MRKKTDFIVVHCAATPPHMDIGAYEITQWHKDRGFRTIGYQDVVRRDGQVEQGRHSNEVGAHVRGYNARSVGICLVGGVDEQLKPQNNFTEQQFKSLKRLLRFYRVLFPDAEVLGHRDLAPYKACPSFDVRDWLKNNPL